MAKKKAKKKEKEPEIEEDQDEESSGFFKKALKVIIGLALIAAGVGSYWYWWPELLLVVKGCLGAFVALIGLIVVMIAWSD